MRVSQRLDYAVRGLVALAQRPDSTPVAASEIADALSLPRRFLEQQFTALAQAGVLECRRGAGGGCTLAQDARALTVADVVRALEGAALDVPRTSGTVVSEMWADVAGALDRVLADVTLADLAARQDRLDAARSEIYYI
jgi:Rrf2 family protein